MGTNVVRLTDRKYMVELRKRIEEDCAELQVRRIENREVIISLLAVNALAGCPFCFVQQTNGYPFP